MTLQNGLLERARRLGPEAVAMCEELATRYEAEMEQMTGHLGQVYEELMLLYGLGEDIGTSLDTRVIADQALQRTRELLVADRGVVVLAEVKPGQAPRCEPIGSEPPPAELMPLLQWATASTVGRDRPFIHNDLSETDAPAGAGTRSLVSAPLRARGRLIGAVHVLDKQGADGFNTEDQALLQTIASHIGVAIENSRLYQEERQTAEHLAVTLDELEDTYDATLAALSGALDLRDNETEGHARRVTQYALRIAGECGIAGDELVAIERGALLHDIGKIGVPDSILLKPGKLTDEEWIVMRSHPLLGWQMIRNIRFLEEAAPIVLHHHERFDGGGYPHGLAGEQIPLGARIFAISDTFDAMTSDRPYRRALPYPIAAAEISRCAGTQFDPVVVECFLAVPEPEWDGIRAVVEQSLRAKRRENQVA